MENPLQNIKNIEASLLQMKARVQNMSKSQLKNVQNIEKAYVESISLIREKIDQCKKEEKKTRQQALKNVVDNNKIQSIRNQKLIHEKQLTRSREILTAIKINQSQLIKDISKKNNSIIEKVKKQQIQNNRLRSQQVKEKLKKSKEKIRQFHLIKKYELKKQKQKEKQQNQKKFRKLANQMRKMCEEQEKIANRYQQSQQMLSKLRLAVKRMEKMQLTDFSKIKENLNLNVDQDVTNLDQQTAQQIITAVIQDNKSKSLYS